MLRCTGYKGRTGKDVEEVESEEQKYKNGQVGGGGGLDGPLVVSVVEGPTSAL